MVLTMIITEGMKQRPKWAKLIREHRLRMKMNQVEFGALFGVTKTAVSLWESGDREAPYDVTWWVFRKELKRLGRNDSKR